MYKKNSKKKNDKQKDEERERASSSTREGSARQREGIRCAKGESRTVVVLKAVSSA